MFVFTEESSGEEDLEIDEEKGKEIEDSQLEQKQSEAPSAQKKKRNRKKVYYLHLIKKRSK